LGKIKISSVVPGCAAQKRNHPLSEVARYLYTHTHARTHERPRATSVVVVEQAERQTDTHTHTDRQRERFEKRGEDARNFSSFLSFW